MLPDDSAALGSMIETFSRFSQSIVDAARATTEEEARKGQKAAALVVNSVGTMVVEPKRDTRKPTQFDEATNLLGDAIQKAREAKRAKLEKNKQSETGKPEAKTLAQPLVEAQDSE